MTTKYIKLGVRSCQTLRTELTLENLPHVDLLLQRQKKSIRKLMDALTALQHVIQVEIMLIKDTIDLHNGTEGTELNILSVVPLIVL
ncbi:hypothetical protein GCM10009118_07970 [Wandonia haliotis]|uniref:Uncharacterized protein n=1 Tax=Wandonia haliotis TaxID=574963 RepID=A0ABN1MME4_9FLAO